MKSKLTMPVIPGLSVDTPADVHLIEAIARGLKETVRCKRWSKVKHVQRHKVLVMQCPTGCCAAAEEIRNKCNLELWEEIE